MHTNNMSTQCARMDFLEVPKNPPMIWPRILNDNLYLRFQIRKTRCRKRESVYLCGWSLRILGYILVEPTNHTFIHCY